MFEGQKLLYPSSVIHHVLWFEEWLRGNDEILNFLEVLTYHPKTSKPKRGTAILTHQGLFWIRGKQESRIRCEFYPYKMISYLVISLQTEGKMEHNPHFAIFMGKETAFQAIFESLDVEKFIEFRQTLSNLVKGYGCKEEWVQDAFKTYK